MSFQLAAWCFFLGYPGLWLCVLGCNSSRRGSALKTWSAIGVLVCAAAAAAMVFQGFHLWHGGWPPYLGEIDPDVAARTSVKGRGRGGILLFLLMFFPQFLVLAFGWTLWEVRPCDP